MQVTKDNLDDFFSSLEETKSKKEEFCSSATNVIYITTRCNLCCDYCYEKDQRQNLKEQKDITKEEITQALEKVNKNNTSGSPATIVIFGGEPLLRPDLIDYLVLEAKRINPNGFAFCLTTNGLYFLKEKNAVWMKQILSNTTISVEVSWDGTGQLRRKTLEGKSSEALVEKALDVLEKVNVPITIRYTVHKGNYDSVVYDMIYCLERWKNIKKIQTSYAYTDLDSTKKPKEIGMENRDFYVGIFEKYDVPVCQEVCDVCQRCVKTDKANYFIPDKPVLKQKMNEKGELQSTVFNHWV